MSEKKFPTWGYRRGEAKIFDLGEGETLPAGWSDAPPPGEHPNVPKGQPQITDAPPAAKVDEPPPWEDEGAEATELPPIFKPKARKAKPIT